MSGGSRDRAACGPPQISGPANAKRAQREGGSTIAHVEITRTAAVATRGDAAREPDLNVASSRACARDFVRNGTTRELHRVRARVDMPMEEMPVRITRPGMTTCRGSRLLRALRQFDFGVLPSTADLRPSGGSVVGWRTAAQSRFGWHSRPLMTTSLPGGVLNGRRKRAVTHQKSVSISTPAGN